MKLTFSSQTEYHQFKDGLLKRFQGYLPRKIEKPDFKKAAVMMLLLNRDGQACVLLTKRTSTVSSHKGQMSFPGGGHEDGDSNLLETALRETCEEMGIAPADIEIAGEFDEFISLAGFHVVCYVGFIPHPYRYIINLEEIEDYTEVPLSIFKEERYDRVERVEYEGRNYSVYYYSYDGFIIWGMTARILTDFARKFLSSSIQEEG